MHVWHDSVVRCHSVGERSHFGRIHERSLDTAVSAFAWSLQTILQPLPPAVPAKFADRHLRILIQSQLVWAMTCIRMLALCSSFWIENAFPGQNLMQKQAA